MHIGQILRKNPSLRSYPAEAVADAYRFALLHKHILRLEPLGLPQKCPWSIDDVLSEEFLPE